MQNNSNDLIKLESTAATCVCRQIPDMRASPTAIRAVGSVFQGLLEAALKDAAAGAFEDEEDNENTGLALHAPTSL